MLALAFTPPSIIFLLEFPLIDELRCLFQADVVNLFEFQALFFRHARAGRSLPLGQLGTGLGNKCRQRFLKNFPGVSRRAEVTVLLQPRELSRGLPVIMGVYV